MGTDLRLSRGISLALALGAAWWMATPLPAQDDANGVPPPPADNNPSAPGPGAPDAGDPGDSSGATFQTFYDSLANQGTWIQSDDYGYVWQPQVNDPDWAPYTEGNWDYTDDGWTWDSSEPWGWATCHYGRWVNLDGSGWCWVPGYTWAPAWVSWRYGDGYCGWAPLPPDSFVGIDYVGDNFFVGAGFHIGGDCDGFYGIGAGCYHFVPVRALGHRNYRGDYLRRSDNFVIINRTTNVTNINVRRGANGHGTTEGGSPRDERFGHVTTGGPKLAEVNAVSDTPIRQLRLVPSERPGQARMSGDSLSVYAPRIKPVSSPSLRPSVITQTINHATINRGADITRPLAVNSRMAPAMATQGEIEQAQLAQYRAPLRAKVATAQSPVNSVLRVPVTSLHPVSAVTASRAAQPGAYTPAPGYAPASPEPRVPSTRSAPAYYPAAPSAPVERSYPVEHSYPAAPSTQVYPMTPYETRQQMAPSTPGSAPGYAPRGYPAAPSAPSAPPSSPGASRSPGSAPAPHASSGGTTSGGNGSQKQTH